MNNEEKKKQLKEIVRQLHSGIPPEQVKRRFRRLLKEMRSDEIAKLEQELVMEGMPREKLHKLCDVHLSVLPEHMQSRQLNLEASHPIEILKEEHRRVLRRLDSLKTFTSMIAEACDAVQVGDVLKESQHIVEELNSAEDHYLREENVLFPIIEKHGITEPPAIMWMEHDNIRALKKELGNLMDKWNTIEYSGFKAKLSETTESLCAILPSHFSKENDILFPAALEVVTDSEWEQIGQEFDEIGYSLLKPVQGAIDERVKSKETKSATKELLETDTGTLSGEEVEAIFNALPIDLSFVDEKDEVKYFNKADKRIFVRTRAVLGRKVQMCHPQKSVHIVNRIIEAFKAGRKNVAEFWITVNERFVHIRYFAVRNGKGKYIGTMEVTQDLTEIKKLEDQKRLLDWKE